MILERAGRLRRSARLIMRLNAKPSESQTRFTTVNAIGLLCMSHRSGRWQLDQGVSYVNISGSPESNMIRNQDLGKHLTSTEWPMFMETTIGRLNVLVYMNFLVASPLSSTPVLCSLSAKISWGVPLQIERPTHCDPSVIRDMASRSSHYSSRTRNSSSTLGVQGLPHVVAL